MDESDLAADCVAYRSRLYKIPMVRMAHCSGWADESANVRVYKKTLQKCKGAFKRSRCGLVEIFPTNDHAVLQAQPS